MEINSINQIKDLLRRFGIAPNKAYGQNFLLDSNILAKIADSAELDKDTQVLEIGPGLGALTDKLCERAGRVVCIEIDGGMLPVLEHTLSDHANVDVINGDVLDDRVRRQAADALGGEFALVANLPYYITTPIIMAFLEGDYKVSSMVLMMQKEVAERMCAVPGTKSYGLLTICMDYYAKTQGLFTISPGCFYPQPKVDSLVVRIIKRKEPKISVKDEKLFFRVVKASFAMRRKTIINNLASAFMLPKPEIAVILDNCGIPPGVRGETLALEDYGRLADEFFKKVIE